MRIARKHCLATIALLLAWLIPIQVVAQVMLSGTYRGTGAAQGALLTIARDSGGFAGEVILPGLASQAFLADRRLDIAEAIVDLTDRPALMQVVPQPYGAEVALIPLGSDGRPDVAGSEVLPFLGAGVSELSYPDGYMLAPNSTRSPVTANGFLVSYPYWRPAAVANGYGALPAKFHTLFRLFPAVQLDVIWRLCSGAGSDQALAIALRGQAVGCAAVLQGLASIQARGRYADFRREVAAETEVLLTSVRCADNYVMPKSTCERVAGQVAAAASELESAAAVLARYR